MAGPRKARLKVRVQILVLLLCVRQRLERVSPLYSFGQHYATSTSRRIEKEIVSGLQAPSQARALVQELSGLPLKK